MDATPTIQWSVALGASCYELDVTRRSSGQSVYFVSLIRSNSHRVASILANGQNEIRVRAIFADGSRSTSSVPLQLWIGPAVLATATSGVLEWQFVAGATHYEVWINFLGNPPVRQMIHLALHSATRYSLAESLPRGRFQLWLRAIRAESGSLYTGEWSSLVFTR